MTGLWIVGIAYLAGAVPTGYLLVQWVRGEDIRRLGSGNIGATNVARVLGTRFGLLVLAIDAAKGFGAVWLALRATGPATVWTSTAAVAVMAGNAYPVLLGFRGGKTFATALGAFLCLAPAAVALEVPVFVLAVAATRRVSVGSLLVALNFPLVVGLWFRPAMPVRVAAAAAAALVCWRHRANLRRLRAGTEEAFSAATRHRRRIIR